MNYTRSVRKLWTYVKPGAVKETVQECGPRNNYDSWTLHGRIAGVRLGPLRLALARTKTRCKFYKLVHYGAWCDKPDGLTLPALLTSVYSSLVRVIDHVLMDVN